VRVAVSVNARTAVRVQLETSDTAIESEEDDVAAGHEPTRGDAFPLSGAALLLVDVQNDFCPGGALPVPEGDRVIPVLNRVAQQFAAAGRPVYASRDWHPADTKHFRAFGGPWPPHCIAESRGAAFHPDLRLPTNTVVISKGQDRNDDGYSAFEGSTKDGRTLAEDLRAHGVSTLYVGGLATDYCVRASVLDARKAGIPVVVLTDGIAGIGPDDVKRALEEMRQAGASLVAGDDRHARLA
jgi:nicotinamidase/pyrazinamidase